MNHARDHLKLGKVPKFIYIHHSCALVPIGGLIDIYIKYLRTCFSMYEYGTAYINRSLI